MINDNPTDAAAARAEADPQISRSRIVDPGTITPQRWSDDHLSEVEGRAKPALLVVEDNPSTLLLLKHVLKSGYEVETATSVDEALGKAATRVFDALILDINRAWLK